MTSVTWYPQPQFRTYLPQQPVATDTNYPLSRTGRKSSPLIPNSKYKVLADDDDSLVLGSSSRTGESTSVAGNAERRRRNSKAPNHYGSGTEMLDALAACFKPGGQAVFSGSYIILNEPGITDKHRVQLVSHDIWRATGYRFTVKDHPPVKDGHKTRLWCSQDIQRKHKSNAKSRVAASGEVLAKVRYSCRSRLLITSRDADVSGYRLVTVRMHHHVPHEPYNDPTTSPAGMQAMWGSSNWPTCITPSTSSRSSTLSNAITPVTSTGMKWDSGSEDGVPGALEEEAISDTDQYIVTPPDMLASSSLTPPHSVHAHPMVTIGQLQSELSVPSFSHISPNSVNTIEPSLDAEHFQRTMRQHIRNIRDFCDGLEYQVQFNDFGMLRELEQRGGCFLRLVHDCLDREGRIAKDIAHQNSPGSTASDS